MSLLSTRIDGRALLKAVGLFFAINALMVLVRMMIKWVPISLPPPANPQPPGFMLAIQIFPLLISAMYYRHLVGKN
jgi:hypothetical protein